MIAPTSIIMKSYDTVFLRGIPFGLFGNGFWLDVFIHADVWLLHLSQLNNFQFFFHIPFQITWQLSQNGT